MFVHPVADERVMAGNGTIGLELLEQLDDFDTVVVPYGGGGLVTGIASAVKATGRRCGSTRSEPETGAPAAATFAAADADRRRVHAVVRRRLRQPRADPARLGARVELLDGAFAIPLAESATRCARSPSACA